MQSWPRYGRPVLLYVPTCGQNKLALHDLKQKHIPTDYDVK